MITFSELQRDVSEWSERNFPNGKPYHPLLGAFEELGELAHAHLKEEQGIRGFQTRITAFNAKMDAIGDVIIYLADYCARSGIDLASAINQTWNTVKKRDWINAPETGKADT